MTELRWILLAAGLLLLAGIYAWGMRARNRTGRAEEAETRPAVFTGGASGFERAEPGLELDAAEAAEERRLTVPAASRRLEPSLALDDDHADVPSRGPDSPVEDEDDVTPLPRNGSRREPTLSARTEAMSGGRLEPTLSPRVMPPAVDPEIAIAPVRPAPAAAPAAAAEAETKPQKAAQRIFALRVTAASPERFDGLALLEALRAESLTHGRYDIFHRLHSDGRPVFSVASLKEPGRFDLQTMPATQYPGVALFAVLPGPVGAADAFDEMLFTARALATHLTGTIGDERGVPLTAARVAALRDNVLEFERTLGSA